MLTPLKKADSVFFFFLHVLLHYYAWQFNNLLFKYEYKNAVIKQGILFNSINLISSLPS